MNANEFKKILIEWRCGRLLVRDGSSGAVIMEWVDPAPFPVTHFGVRTGWGSQGHWRISHFSKTGARPRWVSISQCTCLAFGVNCWIPSATIAVLLCYLGFVYPIKKIALNIIRKLTNKILFRKEICVYIYQTYTKEELTKFRASGLLWYVGYILWFSL